MKMYIYVLLNLCSFALLNAVPYTQRVETKVDKTQQPCQCYCSGKCAPRDFGKQPGDDPQIDPETGICFCQKWDEDNFAQCGIEPADAIEAMASTHSCCTPK